MCNNFIVFIQCVLTETLDLLTVEKMKAELRFVSAIHMGASVLTFGMKLMPKLSVDSWDSVEMVRVDDFCKFFVICSSLSSTGSLAIVSTAENDIFVESVHCVGNEAMLIDCSHTLGNQCLRAELAGVRCEGNILAQ